MKNYIILLLFSLFFSCKTEKKESTSNIDNNISIPVKTNENLQKTNNTLKDKLKGKTYSNIKEIDELKNCYHPGGSVVGKLNGKTFTVSVFHVKEGIPSYILFEESLSSEVNKFKILDVLDLTKEEILKDESYSLNHHFCYKNGKSDEEIVAIAKEDEEEEFFTEIYKAWRADCKKEKFIEIPVEGIKVENMGYGI
ncbi:hypothetical protein [Tenacibaculum geojense]|uniref:Lipoprotein n=1 Tax=Tenacibaculum geojense TaxID=915352 RepID=A0ABW3JR75_9FLAO